MLTSYTPLGAFSPRLVVVDEVTAADAAGGYADGRLYRSIPADRQLDPGALTYVPGSGDLRLEARFIGATTILEPGTLALAGASVALLGAWVRRRRTV